MKIRHFEIKDIKILQKFRYPNKNDLEILSLINEWNKGGCSGRYFEMFTAEQAGVQVAEISIQEHAKDSTSIGIHVFEPYRKKGYSIPCIKFALKRSKEMGYSFAIFLVDKNNLVGTKIANKFGFVAISEFITPKGNTIITFKKPLNL